MATKFSFRSKVWKYDGKAGWYFVTLPKHLSKKIRLTHGLSEEGWGRLKTTSQIGRTNWETAIWYDTKAESYLLPLKSEIRKKETIGVGALINVKLKIKAAPQTKRESLTKPRMFS